jgi:predicted secreted Zn-dependent protease
MHKRFAGHSDPVTPRATKPMKKVLFLLLFFPSALPAFAAGDRIDLASVDRDIYRLRAKAVAPLVTEKQEFYEISGRDEKELRDQMTRNGSSWSDGNKYDSVTRWRVTWDYGYDRTPGSCGADSFRANVEIIIRYPKWLPSEDVPGTLREKWDTYLASLVVHESGHRDMAVEAVEDLTRTVAEMPSTPTCAELDRKIRSLCHERMQKLNDESKEYDVATSHGITQGAIFP